MRFFLYLLFFLSGACGLIYEVVWSRQFVLVTGGTTSAVTAVVASFMAGLAAGGGLAGRFIDRSRLDPMRVYALLEAGIGLLALLVPLGIRLSRMPLAFLYPLFQEEPSLFSLCRFLLTLLILFPASFLMGASFPVLFRAALAEHRHFGRTAGWLYAANTLGAMAGIGLSGFVLLPLLGNRTTTFLAVGVNFAVAAGALFLSFRLPRIEPRAALSPEKARWSWRALLLLGGYGFSGLAALVYQIAWTRALTLTLGSSLHSFTIILISYIAGLGIGSALISRWVDRLRHPWIWVGAMEIGIGWLALGVLPFLDNINLMMMEAAVKVSGAETLWELLRFGVVFALLIGPTLLMGALLPVVAHLTAAERPGAGEPLGLIYAVNTVGAILGSLLAGYFLIRAFGVRNSILAASGLSVLIGVLWMAAAGSWRSLLSAGSMLALSVLLFLLMPQADPLVISAGPYYYARQYQPFVEKGERLREILHLQYNVIYFREDTEVTASVLRTQAPPQLLELRINGKVDASDRVDLPTQIMAAQLPLLLHPRPKRVLVIGLGSGMTAGSVLTHPVDSVHCVELSPAVVEASRFFLHVNNLLSPDPRFRLTITDGRNHLALSSEQYDVIISEPSNPWQAGQGLLFTKEYFELVRERLAPGGLAVSWVGIYDLGLEEVKLLWRTFAAVFPYMYVWETLAGSDYLLVGMEEPLRISFPELKERMNRPAVKRDLGRLDIIGPEDILSIFLMDRELVQSAVGAGPLHTDNRRQLEFSRPRVFGNPEMKGIIAQILSYHRDAVPLVDFGPSPEDQAWIPRLQAFDRLRSYPSP